MKKRENTWFYNIVHFTMGWWLRRFRGVYLTDYTGVDLSNGPCLIISNHVGIFDPFMISIFVNGRTINWVAGAYLFKLPLLRHILSYHLKCIPKQQGMSDLTSVREMQRRLRAGGLVGIFPEGTRSWDGDMVDLDYKALAKLIRIFKVPVLFVHMEGGFAQQPRWSQKPRKGPVNVHFSKLLAVPEITNLNPEELEETVKASMVFSNDQWKNTVAYNYVSPVRAEGLQRVLYRCPACNSIDSLGTSKNSISCVSCGCNAQIDNKDNVVSSTVPFQTIAQWHSWERQSLDVNTSFPQERGVLFQTGKFDDNAGKFTTISKNFTIEVVKNAISIVCNDDSKVHAENTATVGPGRYSIDLTHVSSLILNAKQTIELFYEDNLYRIRLLPDACSLKYQELYQAVQKAGKS